MKFLLLTLLLNLPAHCEPQMHEVVYRGVYEDDPMTTELIEQGINYYFDDEGLLHVIMPEEDDLGEE